MLYRGLCLNGTNFTGSINWSGLSSALLVIGGATGAYAPVSTFKSVGKVGFYSVGYYVWSVGYYWVGSVGCYAGSVGCYAGSVGCYVGSVGYCYVGSIGCFVGSTGYLVWSTGF